MKKTGKYIIVLTGFLALLASCVKEQDTDQPVTGDSATITITAGFNTPQARAYDDPATGDAADNLVKDLRVLIFNASDGKMVHNYYYPNLTSGNPFRINLLTGTYDFVFVANEYVDPALSSQLAGINSNRTLAYLDNLSFSSTTFSTAGNIPMSYIEKTVRIEGDNEYSIGGGATRYGTWEVSLQRLGVRVDIKIFTESNIKASGFEKLEIANVPNSVPILEKKSSGETIYNGGSGKVESSPRSYTVTLGEGGGFQPVVGGYQWVLTRVILPSNMFDPDAEQDALALSVSINGDKLTSSLKTGLSGDYQVPRNTYFVLEANLLTKLEVHLKAAAWDPVNIDDIKVGEKTSLNVSALQTTVNERVRSRIWFWSDAPEVFVEEMTDEGKKVDDIFYNIAGIGAYNVHYSYDQNTRQGSGYIDIMTDDQKQITTTNQTHTLLLNANGLRRSIKVTSRIISSTPIGYFEYVGAFWRNDQVGERVISGRNDGVWTAEIVNGAEWIVIAPGKSMDPDIWTSSPGNAENYPVEGNETSLTGSGYVYFRIGLKGTNIGNAPRYGRVRLTTPTSQTYIYIRQGEEADYLFREEDPDENGKGWGSSSPRPHAGKFSPFNLTVNEFYNNTNSGGNESAHHPTVTSRSGRFTEFPTQAGATFQFAQVSAPVRAYHPTNATSFKAGYWTSNINTVNKYWDEYTANGQEVCPPKYRRPNSGNTNTNSSTNGTIQNSELMQSLLYQADSKWNENTVKNVAFGYYADGYFDRRPIESPETANGSNTYSVVSKGTGHAAFAGALFFNPNEDSNASLFFPCPGYRLHSSGNLWHTGKVAGYWSSSSRSSSVGYALEITSPDFDANRKVIYSHGAKLDQPSANRAYGYNVRCVYDETL